MSDDPAALVAHGHPAPRSNPFRHLGALALIVGGLLAGLTVGALREGALLTALILYAEPLPTVIGVCLIHLCFVRDRWALGVSGALGLGSFLLLSRTIPPVSLPLPAASPPGELDALAACSAEVALPDSLILALWSGADNLTAVTRLTDEADVVVLVNPRVAMPPGGGGQAGEYTMVPGGTIVWSRAGFAACGDEDTWAVGRHSALVFAAPGPDVSVPLLISGLPPLGPELDAEVATVAMVAELLGGAVVAAAGSFPTSFQRTDQRLAGAGLRPVRVPPNAPSTFRGVPLLPLRAVDRVWVTEAWSGRARALESQTAWSAPVLLRLEATYQTP
ncbi:MAG: hypothetical protein EXR69_01805 [Myxococcales bacterium]|nr:hypothetical protein [Myxococcales bacterium]